MLWLIILFSLIINRFRDCCEGITLIYLIHINWDLLHRRLIPYIDRLYLIECVHKSIDRLGVISGILAIIAATFRLDS